MSYRAAIVSIGIHDALPSLFANFVFSEFAVFVSVKSIERTSLPMIRFTLIFQIREPLGGCLRPHASRQVLHQNRTGKPIDSALDFLCGSVVLVCWFIEFVDD